MTARALVNKSFELLDVIEEQLVSHAMRLRRLSIDLEDEESVDLACDPSGAHDVSHRNGHGK